jgi:hypothetical protein
MNEKNKEPIIDDDRLDIIKDVVYQILNITTHLSDEELNEKVSLTIPTVDIKDTINQDEETENQLDYLTNIHLLSVNIEWLGRWKNRNKVVDDENKTYT